MKALKLLGLAAALLTVVCIGGGLLLPGTWTVRTAIVIDAPMERIHREVATPRQFVQHAEAHAKASGKAATFAYTFSETASGKGAWWLRESAGERVRTLLTDADPTQGVWYEATTEGDDVLGRGSLTYEAVDGGVRVSWYDEGQVGGLLGGWMGPLVGGALAPRFDGILQQIKQTCEAE